MNAWILVIIALVALCVVIFLWRRRTTHSSIESPKPSTPVAQKETSPVQVAFNPWSKGLQKSREPFLERLKDALLTIGGKTPWNDSHPLWERLEETLLSADLGPRLTNQLLSGLKGSLSHEPTEVELKSVLEQNLLSLLSDRPVSNIEAKPCVTLLIGVNGAGKTTSAAKLAFQAKASGKTVLLGAADTFRAAAVDQLQAWADRIGIDCIKPAQGANPAAVAFDAVDAAISRGVDELIIDTAGRLHTKENLMDELKKIGRVLDKKIPGAPHRVYLVLDASLGQNAIPQAREFTLALPPTGLILTKLDGSSKGGAALAVTTELGIPISYVGLGESAEDLRAFSAKEFISHLLQI